MRQFFSRFAIALALVLVGTAAGVATGNRWFEEAFDDIENTDIRPDVLSPEEKGEPANFLVVGSDTRAWVDTPEEERAFGSAEEVGGQRSDTLMVVHVDPDTHTGFVVSFPRDLWVRIPGHGESRINAAFSLGGPSLAIETIKANYDVPIQHYLEVDFQGLESIVNTIGGVNVWFPAAARDTVTGLDAPDPGCRELNGPQALSYVRSRKYEWFDTEDGRWHTDPRSDLTRIQRQQYFMRSLAQTALDRGARDPRRAFALLDDVSDALSKDPQLDLSDLKGLINAFRDLDPASIEMMTLPVEAATRGGAAVLVPKQPDADSVLRQLQSFGIPKTLPEIAAPASTIVRVLNGSGVGGRAREVLDALTAYGFVPAGPAADADRDDYPLTQIRYAPGAVTKGLAVAAALGTARMAEARPDELEGADVVAIVGRDWDDLAAPVKDGPPESAPTTAGDAPTSAAPTSAAPTTTVTRPSRADAAVVPVDPETGGPLVGCP
jgi:LCP family protein required for cell wall assembly